MTSTANMDFTPLPPTQKQCSYQAQLKQDVQHYKNHCLQKDPSSLVSQRGDL